jgi:hypothetical protein
VGSTRAEGRPVGAAPRREADLVAAAAALRWARPDLTAELAAHVLEEASVAGQQGRWLAAAGWAVHARAATGDGRDAACVVMAALPRWGSDALAGQAAHRLRVELAMVAAGAGEVESARRLLAEVDVHDSDPELAADVLCAQARCAVEDAPDEVGGALDAADAAWARVGGSAGELGGASVALMRAVVERRAGRPAAAVDHAADGLAGLERGRTGSGTPSAHLAAALAAEWISALLDAGRVREARDGCSALLPRLSEQARPTRQLALLRLTVARALAAQDEQADTTQLLAQAADDAAGSDVPDLEAVCRTALGALHERANQLDVALAELQVGVEAERRDRGRSRRFLAALAELPAEPVRGGKRRRERAAASATTGGSDTTTGDSETTTLLPAITRGDRKLRTGQEERVHRGSGDRRPDEIGAGGQRGGTPAAEPAKSRFERMLDEDPPVAPEPAAGDERQAELDTAPWSRSPIGDLLIRSLRADSAESGDTGTRRRNGRALGGPALRPDGESAVTAGNGQAPGTESAESPGSDAPSGWVPTLDPERAAQRRTQGRRGRTTDADRRRAMDQRPGPRRRSRQGDAHADGTVERTAHGRHGGPSDSADLDDESTTTRSAVTPDEPASAPAEGRPRHGTTPELDRADEESRRPEGTRSGQRPPAEDPWATGRWAVRRDEPGEGESDPPAIEAVEPSAAAPAGAGDDSDGWLAAALADLDRTLSGIGLGESARTEDRPQDDGCAVVVDIARDARRFAGPRAAAVVRSVADLVADRLPAGAHSRFGDSDTLVVTGPGWSRADATDWMHRTLPGLLDGFVVAEDLPGAQLRVAVHDADGPVGAQILQPLTAPGRERERGNDGRGDHAGDHTAGASEARAQKYRAAARAGRQGRGGEARARREVESEPAEQPADDGDSPLWPFSGGAGRSRDPDPAVTSEQTSEQTAEPTSKRASDRANEAEMPGRHDADRGRQAGATRAEAPERGRRHRAGEESTFGERDRGEPVVPGRAGRRNGEAVGPSATGADTPDASRTGRRARHSGRETVGSGADRGSSEPSSGPSAARSDSTTGTTGTTGSAASAVATGVTPSETAAGSGGGQEPSERERDRPESTEGLGIADLLAGALAAYRGI